MFVNWYSVLNSTWNFYEAEIYFNDPCFRPFRPYFWLKRHLARISLQNVIQDKSCLRNINPIFCKQWEVDTLVIWVAGKELSNTSGIHFLGLCWPWHKRPRLYKLTDPNKIKFVIKKTKCRRAFCSSLAATVASGRWLGPCSVPRSSKASLPS